MMERLKFKTQDEANKAYRTKLNLANVTPLRETDKALLVKMKRTTTEMPKRDMEKNGDDLFVWAVYEDEVWIPKSQIDENGNVSSWFIQKMEGRIIDVL